MRWSGEVAQMTAVIKEVKLPFMKPKARKYLTYIRSDEMMKPKLL
jgi:hypothetical protein